MSEQQKYEQALQQFGQFLIKRVRDVTILHFQNFLDGEMKDAKSKEDYASFADFDEQKKTLIKKLATKVTDETLYLLLDGISADFGFDAFVKVENGESVNLMVAGEEACFDLKLELLNWIDQYSQYKTD